MHPRTCTAQQHKNEKKRDTHPEKFSQEKKKTKTYTHKLPPSSVSQLLSIRDFQSLASVQGLALQVSKSLPHGGRCDHGLTLIIYCTLAAFLLSECVHLHVGKTLSHAWLEPASSCPNCCAALPLELLLKKNVCGCHLAWHPCLCGYEGQQERCASRHGQGVLPEDVQCGDFLVLT
jgi:hypothetical protein